MGSNRDNRRDSESNGRRGAQDRRRKFVVDMERLESRRLLAFLGSAAPTWTPTSTNLADAQNGPLAKGGQDLVHIYQEFIAPSNPAWVNGSFRPTESSQIEFKGNDVGVDISVFGTVAAYTSQVTALGMQVQAIDTTDGIVEGLLPISALPAVAELKNTVNIQPIFNPYFSSVGVATNQGEHAVAADAAKNQFGVDGAGVTVGVISNSVNQFKNGLADSVSTGDLPNNVKVLSDGAAGDPDEGRAMLEEIHDIATGANLQFATGEGGEVAFANSIKALAAAGSNVIVDDGAYPTEPYYQDGPIAQAVTSVVNSGVTYVSSAGNAADSGYQSNFRGANGTVTGVGTGRFMNFNPGGGPAALSIGINVYSATNMVFQFDQPTFTTNGVTSNVQIFVINQATGTVVASGTTNTIATQTPIQLLGTVNPGLYNVVVQVVSGPDPGHISFYEPGDGGFSVDHQYGSAGGTTYAEEYGHHASADTIATGATPWFNDPAYYSADTYYTEPFSAFGPVLSVFNPDGTKKATPQVLLKPDVIAPDGIDTSFFPQGGQISTLNVPFPQTVFPPYTGEPATVRGEVDTPIELDGNANPNFFGTSAAAPQVAAVAALMKQLAPTSTPATIRAGLVQSTLPLNGATKGTWSPQSGYGLIQATSALAAVSTLRVLSTYPVQGSVVTVTPTGIFFTLSQPINLSTVTAADLTFLSSSIPGDSFAVTGSPFQSPTDPTIIGFPISFTHAPGATINATYNFSLSGAILSTTGKQLVPYAGSFGINDVTAPRITTATYQGRFVQVVFNKEIDPSTLTPQSFFLIRAGTSGVLGNPSNIAINTDPRIKVTYDPTTRTATLDLSQIPQTELPSDHYAIVVLDTVSDVAGNKLDGEFSGFFPSGNGTAGGVFIDDIGVHQIAAPTILTLSLSPASDTGIAGDKDTDQSQPTFVGQVSAQFPAASNGLTVVAEFNSLHDGTFDLGQGLGGVGFTGGFDVTTTTDANGFFSFQAPLGLPAGFQVVRVVVVGASGDSRRAGPVGDAGLHLPGRPQRPGLDHRPELGPAGAKIGDLTTVTIDATDPVRPATWATRSRCRSSSSCRR